MIACAFPGQGVQKWEWLLIFMHPKNAILIKLARF